MTVTYLFAGGGTGGHIFPALAIHEQLQELSPAGAVRSVFVCSDRPLDTVILEKECVEHRILPAKPFGAHPLVLVRFIRHWGSSLRTARRIIRLARQEGDEVHVVAMGGFIAAPMARAAAVERVPLMLVNMDAIPGRANRWIASMAQRIVTSAPIATGAGGSWKMIPPIVRRMAFADRSAAACREELGLDPKSPTLLITGASQGARSINEFMVRLVQERTELLRGWQVIHQTGAREDDDVRRAYAAANVPAFVQPFLDAMGLAWGAADLAVSRAGAGSVAEAWANQTPTIFLPYPYHRDQHQRYNARPLEEAGGAVIVPDLMNAGANVQAPGPGPILAELVRNAARRDEMRAALAQLGPADGARQVAEMLLIHTK